MRNVTPINKVRLDQPRLIAGRTVLTLYTNSREPISVLFIGCFDDKEIFRTTDGRHLALMRHPFGYTQPDGTLLTISLDPSIKWSEVEVEPSALAPAWKDVLRETTKKAA
jgi:hypothetical protein